MNKKFNKIIIATGGTGGHVFPAYSLAKHFIRNRLDVEIVSDKRGLRYLKNGNFKITHIPSSTIYNKNILRLIFSVMIILFSIINSIIFLLKKKPDLVFGMGGYSSFPTCVAAKLIGVPFIIYENNLFMGKANKYLSKYAKKIFTSSKELIGIPDEFKNKNCVIGNIIRQEILDFKVTPNFEKNTKLKILILGGSQAAKVFAEELPKVFKQCIDDKISLEIYQQCLPEQEKHLTSFYNSLNINCEIFTFSDNILNYFSKTNLVITRSGSSILAELVNVKIPFISVPLPSSAEGHQLKNAIYYEKNGYSYLIEEKELDIKLFELLKKINSDKSLLNKMSLKQGQYSDKSVYENIDKQIKELENEKY